MQVCLAPDIRSPFCQNGTSTIIKLTMQAAVVTSATKPLTGKSLRHAERVSGNCRKWSGTMLGFWHTTLLVGPERRSQLDSSQCLDCGWSAAGSKTAIAIAEEAHVCVRPGSAEASSPSTHDICYQDCLRMHAPINFHPGGGCGYSSPSRRCLMA